MQFDPRTRSLVLHTEDPFRIRALIPQSRVLDHDQFNLAVRYSDDSARVLRNLGIDVPAPIQTLYNWPGKHKPFSHQREMAEFMTEHARCFNLSEMGTMKTSASLWAADYLISTGAVRRVLILSPLSTLERVWKQEIFDTLMHRNAIVVHGTRERRLQALEADVDFYILNHEGVTLPAITEAIRRRGDIDLVIVDEGSKFRNHRTSLWKCAKEFLMRFPRVWWLTGTPTPNEPTDAWAQAQIISPANVPKFFGSFKRETMAQVSQFRWVPRQGSNTRAFEALQPAIRFEKKDCIDLPPVVTLDRYAELTSEQRTAFKTMHDAMVAGLNNGEQLTAVNAADKINKLRQILCGAAFNPRTDDYVTLAHKPRLDVLLEVIEEASAKVLVIVPFKGIIQTLGKEVSKHHSIGILNGDVSIGARNRIITDFKTRADPHVLLCHPKVMSHGLNLTEADTLVFYAPIYSNDEYSQVIERFNRAGQTRKMTIVRIGSHSLEWNIYKMVDARKATQDNLLSLYRDLTTEGV